MNIDHIVLWVDDQQRSLAFFVDDDPVLETQDLERARLLIANGVVS